MLFGVESGVGRGMGVLDGGGYYQKGMDSSGGPIVTNENFVA